MASFVALSSILAVAFAPGCSDDAVTATEEDAGDLGDVGTKPFDGGKPSDAPSNTDTSTTPPTPGVAAACAAQAAFDARCNNVSQCDKDENAQCPQYMPLFSAAVIDATVTCGPTSACKKSNGSRAEIGDSDCFKQKIAQTPRSAGELKTAQGWCAFCQPDGGAACVTDFFKDESNIDGGKRGPGVVVPLLNDTLIVETQQKCLLAPGADAGNISHCSALWAFCPLSILAKASQPKPAICNDI